MSGLNSRYILFKEVRDEDDMTNRPTTYEADQYHDLLRRMREDDKFMAQLPHDIKQAMAIVQDVLCWTLGHDSNPNLEDNLIGWARSYQDFVGEENTYDN